MNTKLIGGFLIVFGLVLIILGAVVLGSKKTFTKDVNVSQFSNNDQAQLTNIERASIGVIVIGVFVFIPGLMLALGKSKPSAPASMEMNKLSMGQTRRYYF